MPKCNCNKIQKHLNTNVTKYKMAKSKGTNVKRQNTIATKYKHEKIKM